MTCMVNRSRRIMLDTNIWLDCFIPARNRQDLAWSLLDEALKNNDEVLYATETAKDVFYTIARSLKAEEREVHGSVSDSQARAINEAAWGVVGFMADVATATGAEQPEVRLAHELKSSHRDFEDNLLVAAAVRADVDYLVTGDEALARHAPVAALPPEDMLALLKGNALP